MRTMQAYKQSFLYRKFLHFYNLTIAIFEKYDKITAVHKWRCISWHTKSLTLA